MVYNIQNFFELQFKMKNKEVFIESLTDYPDQFLKIGKYTPSEPFKMKVSEGKKFFDIIRFQDVFNFAISEKLFNLLKKEDLTGWKAYRIEIIEEVDRVYYGFQVTGYSGSIVKPKEKGFVLGQEFDYNTWDGSDFFCPEGTMLTFCSEKVKDLFTMHKITNVELKHIETVKWYNL